MADPTALKRRWPRSTRSPRVRMPGADHPARPSSTMRWRRSPMRRMPASTRPSPTCVPARANGARAPAGSGYAGAERLGHGAGYVYAHDQPDAVAAQQYLPDDLHGRTDYYQPTDRGFEARLQQRWEWLRERLRT